MPIKKLTLVPIILLLAAIPWQFAFAHSTGDIHPHKILMTKDGFAPKTLEITQGDTVIFKNTGAGNHWPASNIHPTHTVYPNSDIRKCGTNEAEKIFDACETIKPDKAYQFLFKQQGEWRYHDHLNPRLGGTIVVSKNSEFTDTGEQEEIKPNILREIFTDIRTWFLKIYFALFSGQREKFLAQTSIPKIAGNDKKLSSLIRIFGPEAVMKDLLKDTGGGSTIDCHREAHRIGKASYQIHGATVFVKGDASCHSGFYHGAMEAFLQERGTQNLTKEISALCKQFRTQFGIFECLHGIGHGVMAYETYDLPASLETCARMKTDYERSACYGGAFMENIVAGQGFGALTDHKTDWVNDDPHFPCNKIGNDYSMRYQCYQMQTSWMLTLYAYNFDPVIQECLKAPADMQSVCYKSLGRDAAGNVLRNPQKIAAICAKVPKANDYPNQCVIGAVNVIVDFWGEKLEQQAAELCKLLPPARKSACYTTLAGRLKDIFAAPDKQLAACGRFEPQYRSLCSFY